MYLKGESSRFKGKKILKVHEMFVFFWSEGDINLKEMTLIIAAHSVSL